MERAVQTGPLKPASLCWVTDLLEPRCLDPDTGLPLTVHQYLLRLLSAGALWGLRPPWGSAASKFVENFGREQATWEDTVSPPPGHPLHPHSIPLQPAAKPLDSPSHLSSLAYLTSLVIIRTPWRGFNMFLRWDLIKHLCRGGKFWWALGAAGFEPVCFLWAPCGQHAWPAGHYGEWLHDITPQSLFPPAEMHAQQGRQPRNLASPLGKKKLDLWTPGTLYKVPCPRCPCLLQLVPKRGLDLQAIYVCK